MRKPALRWLTSFALVASSLVAAAAPPASAHHNIVGQYPDSPYRGNAKIEAQMGQADTTIWANAYVLPSGQSSCSSAQGTEWAFAPGSTTNLCVQTITDWDWGGGHDFPAETWTRVKLTIRDMNGNTLGDPNIHKWEATNPAGNPGCQFGTCYMYSPPIPFRFDDNPLNGVNDAVRTGSFELYLELTTTVTCANTCTSRGTGGPYLDAWAQGYLVASNGLMAGLTPFNAPATDVTNLQNAAGKNFPLIRMFRSSWGLPCQAADGGCGQGDVRAMMEAGKLVIWTNKPNVTPSGNKPNGTPHTKWSYVASGAVDGGTNGLDAQLARLNDWADNPGAPGQVIYGFHHEPHNDTGSYGTAQDYRAAFKHVKDRIAGACGGPCTRVKLMYIAIDTKAVAKSSGNAIGTNDQFYPGDQTVLGTGGVSRPCSLTGAPVVNCVSGNVDLLGHDVYNYYQYTAGGSSYHNGTWRELGSYKMYSSSTGVVYLAKKLQKKIIFAEAGSHPGCLSGDTAEGCNLTSSPANRTRDDWFRDAFRTLEQSTDWLTWFGGFSYYHQVSTWDWRFMDAPDAFHQRGKQAWFDMIRDNPLFKSTPVTL